MRVGLDRAIKLTFHGARVSSDGGLFPYRDLDDAAGLTESVAADLFDFRTGANTQHTMTALLRQSIYSRVAGDEDVNDANQARLQMHVLAYNLANFLPRVALPASVKHWSLTTLREKLIKIGARMVRHARCVTFQLAEGATSRGLHWAILRRVRRFAARPPVGPARGEGYRKFME